MQRCRTPYSAQQPMKSPLRRELRPKVIPHFHRHVSPQGQRHVSPQPQRMAASPLAQRTAARPLAARDPMLGGRLHSTPNLSVTPLRVKDMASPQRFRPAPNAGQGREHPPKGQLSPQALLAKQAKGASADERPGMPPSNPAREMPRPAKRLDVVASIAAPKAPEPTNSNESTAYPFPRLLGSAMSMAAIAEKAVAPCPEKVPLSGRGKDKPSAAARPLVARPTSPSPLPKRPAEPMCSIDGLTEVPQGLFNDLLRAGQEVKSRGNHVLMLRSRTNKASRLIHSEVCRRMAAQKKLEQQPQQQRCAPHQEQVKRVHSDSGFPDLRLPLAAAC